jgi:hypothetical protein
VHLASNRIGTALQYGAGQGPVSPVVDDFGHFVDARFQGFGKGYIIECRKMARGKSDPNVAVVPTGFHQQTVENEFTRIVTQVTASFRATPVHHTQIFELWQGVRGRDPDSQAIALQRPAKEPVQLSFSAAIRAKSNNID